MKKRIALIMALLLMISLFGCAAPEKTDSQQDLRIKIPDVTGSEEDIAKNILSSNGFIPVVEYAYSDDTAEGCVIETDPAVGKKVEKGTKVILYISKGASLTDCKTSMISWYNMTAGEDNWEFSKPYIYEGYLYITVYPTLQLSLTLKNYGVAALGTQKKETVATLLFENDAETLDIIALQEAEFTIAICVEDIPKAELEAVAVELYYADPSTAQGKIPLEFTITW